MVIVFRSIIHGQCGNSVNAALMALLVSERYEKKSVLMQIGSPLNRADNLFGLDTAVSYEKNMEPGIETVIMGIKAGRCDNRLINSCCTDIRETKLSVLTGPSGVYQDYSDAILTDSFCILIDRLEQLYEHVFVDIGIAGDNPIAESIAERAGVIVTSLCQNKYAVDRAIQADICNIEANIYYLIGQYQDNLKWNFHNLKKHYKFLSDRNSGIIPYNKNIADAVSGRGLADFLQRYGQSERWEYSYNCIQSITQQADRIYNYIEKRIKAYEA